MIWNIHKMDGFENSRGRSDTQSSVIHNVRSVRGHTHRARGPGTGVVAINDRYASSR